MSAFGGSSQRTDWHAIQEYVPLIAFALIFLSVLFFRPWIFHVAAFVALPCLLVSTYLVVMAPFLGLPLTAYFALWLYVYYRIAFRPVKGNDDEA